DDAASKDDKPSIWTRRPVVIIGTILLVGILIWGLGKVARSFSREGTDDAFLATDIVSVAPKVSGEVRQVFVSDNQIIKTGDPLAQIDPRDFETALAQKKAALVAANANTNVIYASF